MSNDFLARAGVRCGWATVFGAACIVGGLLFAAVAWAVVAMVEIMR